MSKYNAFADAIYNFLENWEIKVSKSLFTQLLNSHEDYPSLKSIIDTLDYLKIETHFLSLNASELEKVPFPFIVQYRNENNQATIEVKKTAGSLNKLLDKKNNNSEYLVVIPNNNSPENRVKPYTGIVNHEAANKASIALFTISGIALFLMLGGTLFSGYTYFFLITSLLGIVLSATLSLRENGIDSTLSQMICKGTHMNNCTATNPFKTGYVLTIADISLSYFITLFICFLYEALFLKDHSIAGVLMILSFITIPVTILSLTYQFFIIRKACAFCLMIIACLWVQVVLFFLIRPIHEIDYLFAGAFVSFVYFLAVSGWLLLKQLLLQSERNILLSVDLLKFKRRPDIFFNMLNSGRKINYTILKDDIIVGNPEAQLKMLVIYDLFCAPCAKLHSILEHTMSDFESKIQLVIRFKTHTAGGSGERHVANLIYALHHHFKTSGTLTTLKMMQAISKWFELNNTVLFEKYCSIDQVENKMAFHSTIAEWVEMENLTGSPRLIINGRSFHDFYYSTTDLPLLISEYMNNPVVNSLVKNKETQTSSICVDTDINEVHIR
jgi:hypothetical protein